MALGLLFYLGIGIWLVWAVFVTRMVNGWFTRKYAHLVEWGVQHDPQFAGFHRNDFQHWSRRDMILGGIFLLPPRLLGFFAVFVLGIPYVKLMMLVHGVSDLDNQSEAFQKATHPVFRKLTRIGLFLMGFHRVETIAKPLGKAYAGLRSVAGQKPALIISNHVSLADMIYLAQRPENMGFVAKAGVSKIPVVSFWARLAQCLFFSRQSGEARKEIFEAMQDRVERIEAGKPLAPIVVFPEGTVGNGRTLLAFKKGAFALGKPLKVIGLKYFGNFSPSFNMMNMLDALLGLMMQPQNSLTAIEIDGLVAPRPGLTWQEFAAEVKRMMCEEFGLESSENSLPECIACHKKYGKFGDADFQ